MFDYISTFFWSLYSMTLNVSLINSWWIVICYCLYWICSLRINRNIQWVLRVLFNCILKSLWSFLFVFFLPDSKHSFKEIKCSFKEIINFIILRFSFNSLLNQNLASLKIDLISLNNLPNYRSYISLLSQLYKYWRKFMKFSIFRIVYPRRYRKTI